MFLRIIAFTIKRRKLSMFLLWKLPRFNSLFIFSGQYTQILYQNLKQPLVRVKKLKLINKPNIVAKQLAP